MGPSTCGAWSLYLLSAWRCVRCMRCENDRSLHSRATGQTASGLDVGMWRAGSGIHLRGWGLRGFPGSFPAIQLQYKHVVCRSLDRSQGCCGQGVRVMWVWVVLSFGAQWRAAWDRICCWVHDRQSAPCHRNAPAGVFIFSRHCLLTTHAAADPRNRNRPCLSTAL